MLWPRAVIWERYREYTAYPDYRDLRDRILDVPNYVGGYEEWLVRAELLVRERSALGTTEAHGGILAEEGRAEVSSPSDQHSLSDLRGIISTGPEEMTRSRRPPSWERRRNAGRGGRGFSAPSPPRHPDQRRGNNQQNLNNINNNRDRGYDNSSSSHYRPPDDGQEDRNRRSQRDPSYYHDNR
jgi:hypothetical protein